MLIKFMLIEPLSGKAFGRDLFKFIFLMVSYLELSNLLG